MIKRLILLTLVLTGLYVWWRVYMPASLVLASTTSTEDTGLLKVLTAQFTAKTGIGVKVIAVGTGQAFAIAARKDADALLVHDRKGEDDFVQKGLGYERVDVMFNDLILLAPQDATCNYSSITLALKDITEKGLAFAMILARIAKRCPFGRKLYYILKTKAGIRN
jgi:tungstate transport system substrate-binding protein